MYETLTDKRAILNTIGCLMLDPTLIDDIDRPLDRTDFDTEALYELLYVAIFNSYMQGVKDINEFTIDSYLSSYKDILYLGIMRRKAIIQNQYLIRP